MKKRKGVFFIASGLICLIAFASVLTTSVVVDKYKNNKNGTQTIEQRK